MAKQAAMGDRLLVAGFNLSGDIGSLSRIGGGPAALDVTAIDKSGYERLGGLRDGGIDFTSWFNPSAARAHPVLAALPTADVGVTYLRGTGVGSPAASCVAKQVGYDGTRGQDGQFSLNVATTANAYGLEWGLQLTSGVRTDTTGTNGASLDGLAASSFGGQVYAHCFGVTGTSVTLTVQDGADNSSWANLTGAAFTAFTGPGWQRLQLANNATVRRYLRVVSSGTFTSASFVVAFVRNEIAGVTF